MIKEKPKASQSRIIGCAAFCAAALFTAFFVFRNLGADEILGFDEGRHAVNALEMYESGDLIVSTYNGETDYYNLKPPLSMYLIMLNYAIFGKNLFAIRIGAACCYFLTALFSALYVYRRRNWWAGCFTLLLFGCSMQLLMESMARKGDANALYQLFATGAMLLLLLLCRRKQDAGQRAFLLYGGIGLCCAAAFLAKSFHAAVPLLIVLIVLLFLGRRATCAAEWGILAGCTAVPVLFWVALRFSRDGTAFLKEMLLEDVIHRSTDLILQGEHGVFYYFSMLLGENTTLVVLFLLGICGALALYQGAEKGAEKRLSRAQKAEWLTLVLWILLPCLLFAIPKTKLYTYAYASFIGLYVAGGMVLPKLFRRTGHPLVRIIAAAFGLFGAVLLGVNAYRLNGYISKESPDSFELLLQENEEVFSGTGNLYSTNRNELMDGVWLQEELLAVKLYTELHCADGGTEGYLRDEGECLLIIDYIWSSEEEIKAAEAAGGEQLYQDSNYVVLKKSGAVTE